jgi:hypothetical protein
MRGRAFLDLAREVIKGATEVHWRGTVVHAYYALLLECRDALVRWGFPTPPNQGMHASVRLRFTYARDVDLRRIGDKLDGLVRDRNAASYNLQTVPWFGTDAVARRAIQDAADGLTLLDMIDGDAGRRAAAIATITP